MKWLFNTQGHLIVCGEIYDLFTRHRQLTFEMTKREIQERYLGQVFGVLWALGHPLILMGVYIFIFVFVFKIKLGGTVEMPMDYTTYLLSGLIPWLCFQESMAKSSMAIIANSSLVKQVVFPVEVLPVKGVIASLITMLISLVILFIYSMVSHGGIQWTYILVPVLVVLQTLAMIGVGFIFSSIGVYFRDLKDFVQVFNVIGVFLLPVFYLPESVPGTLRPLLYLNPFSYLVWCYQDALYFGRIEHPWAWGVNIASSLIVFYVGFRLFRKLKTMFGNVL